jgi:hypothetical protein
MAKADFQILLEQSVDTAEFFLKKSREFYPFCWLLDSNGVVKGFGEQLDDDHPPSQEVIDQLKLRIGKMRDIKAAVIVYMVDFESKDAICMDMDHIHGERMTVIIPYEFKGFRKQLALGEAVYTESDKRFVNVYDVDA